MSKNITTAAGYEMPTWAIGSSAAADYTGTQSGEVWDEGQTIGDIEVESFEPLRLTVRRVQTFYGAEASPIAIQVADWADGGFARSSLEMTAAGARELAAALLAGADVLDGIQAAPA
ncbi:hypothetical protein [Cellulomonas sp. URHB0016]